MINNKLNAILQEFEQDRSIKVKVVDCFPNTVQCHAPIHSLQIIDEIWDMLSYIFTFALRLSLVPLLPLLFHAALPTIFRRF